MSTLAIVRNLAVLALLATLATEPATAEAPVDNCYECSGNCEFTPPGGDPIDTGCEDFSFCFPDEEAGEECITWVCDDLGDGMGIWCPEPE